MNEILESVCEVSSKHDDIMFIIEVTGQNVEIRVDGADKGVLLTRSAMSSLCEYDFEIILKGMIYSLRGFVDEQ